MALQINKVTDLSRNSRNIGAIEHADVNFMYKSSIARVPIMSGIIEHKPVSADFELTNNVTEETSEQLYCSARSEEASNKALKYYFNRNRPEYDHGRFTNGKIFGHFRKIK